MRSCGQHTLAGRVPAPPLPAQPRSPGASPPLGHPPADGEGGHSCRRSQCRGRRRLLWCFCVFSFTEPHSSSSSLTWVLHLPFLRFLHGKLDRGFSHPTPRLKVPSFPLRTPYLGPSNSGVFSFGSITFVNGGRSLAPIQRDGKAQFGVRCRNRYPVQTAQLGSGTRGPAGCTA